ncbi:MAG TPA: tetratricopeptide repeat protein, partial [Pyrinomonadaceae bacterium]
MKVFLILNLVLLLTALSVSAQTRAEYNQQQLKAAQELVDTGHRSEALVELYKILDANGFDPVGFYNLGNAFARLGESDAAVRAYKRA